MVRTTAAAVLVTVATATGLVAPAHAADVVAPGPPTAVAIETAKTPVCIGDPARVTWAPPADDTGDLTGYRVIDTVQTAVGASVRVREVGPEARSLALGTSFGLHSVVVLAVNAVGSASAAAPGLEVAKPPTAVTFLEAIVGDGTVTVRFGWPGPATTVTTGGAAMVPVMHVRTTGQGKPDERTAAPGEAVTFDGLPNGEAVTFDAVVTNACGESAGAGGSPELTPSPRARAAASGPAIVDPRPPLRARAGRPYIARFTATGAPAPTFALRDAPVWLSVDAATGRVAGVPPRRLESFSFTLVATNGAGPDSMAGPFEVVLRTPVRALSRR